MKMKNLMLNKKEVKDTVFNLEWTCPLCKKENIEYHFQDWKYKKRFWCRECRKVIYKED